MSQKHQKAYRAAKKRKSTTSIYKGVSKRGCRWDAKIHVSGIRHHLGAFKTQTEAAIAYDLAARVCVGLDAALNFPHENEKSAEVVNDLPDGKSLFNAQEPDAKLLPEVSSQFYSYYLAKDGTFWFVPHDSLPERLSSYLPNGGRYLKISICGVLFVVHQAVCTLFHGPRPEGLQVRHLDGNSMNNHKDNLCWGTAQENADDRIRHGTSGRGETHPLHKLSEEEVRQIRVMKGAAKDVGEIFGVSKSLIQKIRKGDTWTWIEGPKVEDTKPRGENHGMAVLTVEVVKYIRSSNLSGRELSDELGIPASTIYGARQRRTWAQVTDDP